MDNKSSTEHIANDEVRYYYDRVFQKVSKEIRKKYNDGEYKYLGQEGMGISLIIFDKFKIQFYSAMSLAYRCTQNPLNQYEYIDIASIETIIRACYETFLTFQYIYMQPEFIGEKKVDMLNSDENEYSKRLKLKILLYQYEGYKQSYYGFSTVPEKKEVSKELRDKYKKQIMNDEIFNKLNSKEKESVLKNWRPSWNKIASETELSEWNSKNMYNIISQYCHNSYTMLLLLNHHYTHLDEFDRDSMFVQLFEFTAILINNYIRLFHIDHAIFEQDEINLLSEFYTLAQKNPTDKI
ncbi:Uncharacterised protein [[Clostridium] sordellii]|uniref:hypothetical protein n=1 Tax=Paraclostridium sordellii TaxID=1505 RepID=UPI0005DC5DFD|nr:hypothetical protein [Paeniclostridium sordellii]CEP94805.1 Uncharacterised protein [[Clostridium] sordellii] [Paeniclostridium sordellii]